MSGVPLRGDVACNLSAQNNLIRLKQILWFFYKLIRHCLCALLLLLHPLLSLLLFVVGCVVASECRLFARWQRTSKAKKTNISNWVKPLPSAICPNILTSASCCHYPCHFCCCLVYLCVCVCVCWLWLLVLLRATTLPSALRTLLQGSINSFCFCCCCCCCNF